jgi:RNA polymerase sigma-70 factor, ECF subfamily
VSHAAAPAGLELELERYRSELTGYCYRMLGSGFEAEDAVQETFVRAWRAYDRFEGRAALRSWLHRIATNVCLSMMKGRQRRARPMDLEAVSTVATATLGTLPEGAWIEPMPDSRVIPVDGDPAEVAAARETIRLAFLATLQKLPPKQRAVLILREVLHWHADEVAELLETSVASVNSALQRARATIAAAEPDENDVADPSDEAQQELLARYVDTFERYDVESLVALLHEDATMCMPPYSLWLRGPEDVAAWHVGPGAPCRGSRLVPVRANGCWAFGQYRPSGPDGEHEPWALQVVEIRDGRIAGLNAFLDVERMFPLFGLPATPPPAA